MNTDIAVEEILNSIDLALLVVNKEGMITFVNSQAVMLLGIDSEKVLGSSLNNIFPVAVELVTDSYNKRQLYAAKQLLWKGAPLFLDVTPLLRQDEVLGTLCTLRDAGSRDQAVDAASSYEHLSRLFETIFHSSSDGVWVCDGNGVVININKASETLNGIKAEDVIGHSIKKLVSRKIFDKSVTTKVMESGKRQTVMQHITKTGKYLLSTGTPSLTEDGKIALIVVNERDMTELNTLRKQFEQSQKVRERYREELTEISLLELERNDIIAESVSMRRILQMALKLSHIGASNILILGESGTGKGLLARLIHKNSSRNNHPLVEINCAALPENLLEAELFGYEKGAFTGADEKGKIGLFELAQGGTLFLDEIGDMPLALQAKLLKYLDNKEIRRVGGTKSIKVECGTIAATNKDLEALVGEKTFRNDLYYRLNSFILNIPPLRERREDIAGLIRFYLNESNCTYHCSKTINSRAMRSLQGYKFPGNVRELKNILENAVVMSNDDQINEFILASVSDHQAQIEGDNLSMPINGDLQLADKLRAYERHLLNEARKRCRTTREAARLLGISQPSVVRKFKQFGVD
jgi:PAS domain S-box-containing protein